MNAIPETSTESNSVMKQAFIEKAINQFIPSATHSCSSPAVKDVFGDMEAFLSGVLVFHCAHKR